MALPWQALLDVSVPTVSGGYAISQAAPRTSTYSPRHVAACSPQTPFLLYCQSATSNTAHRTAA